MPSIKGINPMPKSSYFDIKTRKQILFNTLSLLTYLRLQRSYDGKQAMKTVCEVANFNLIFTLEINGNNITECVT